MEKCSICKKNDGAYSFKGYMTKKGIQRYHFRCRECNTAISKKYRSTEKGKLAIGRCVKKSIKKYQYKQNARMLIAKSIRMGILLKEYHCSKCFSDYHVQAHHDDYSKPLDIIWLCKFCHIKADNLSKSKV